MLQNQPASGNSAKSIASRFVTELPTAPQSIGVLHPPHGSTGTAPNRTTRGDGRATCTQRSVPQSLRLASAARIRQTAAETQLKAPLPRSPPAEPERPTTGAMPSYQPLLFCGDAHGSRQFVKHGGNIRTYQDRLRCDFFRAHRHIVINARI